jgi:integrase/recombinase XerD
VGEKEGLDLQKHIQNFLLAKQVEGKSPATLTFYRQNLGRVLWWLEHNHIREDMKSLDVNIIRLLLAYVQTAINRWGIGSKSSEHKASMSTVDAYWRTLQALFAWLVRENVMDVKNNPMKRIPRPKCQQKVVQDIPLELIRKALIKHGRNAFLNARNCAIILILLDTGMRLSECTGIKLFDINLQNGLIRILGKGGKRATCQSRSDRPGRSKGISGSTIRPGYRNYGSTKMGNPWGS